MAQDIVRLIWVIRTLLGLLATQKRVRANYSATLVLCTVSYNLHRDREISKTALCYLPFNLTI